MTYLWFLGLLYFSSFSFVVEPVVSVHVDVDKTVQDVILNGTSLLLLPKKTKLDKVKRRKASKKDRCCQLGREMAKIGESCTYTTSLASIKPNYKHYHKMKTKIWIRTERPIKPGLLRRCKRFKVFYEKCCSFEAYLIDQDLKRMFKRLQNFFDLKKRKRNKRRGRKSKKSSVQSFGNAVRKERSQ